MYPRDYYLAFSYFPGIGPRRLQKLLTVCGSEEAIWDASQETLQKILGPKIGEDFNRFRKTFSIEKTKEELEKKKITFVTILDKEYPQLLKQTNKKNVILNPFDKLRVKDLPRKEDSSHDAQNDKAESEYFPPFLLYVKGNVALLNTPKIIGIVGTRKITSYGEQVTRMIVADLVQEDFVVVSGLALGVDAAAHTTTLKHIGKTIAVLGSGVDVCSPRENQYLYDAILSNNGAIVSTFLPGMDATIGSFPARNAIIAGLSLGVVVTEGAKDSGSLITAQDATRFGRMVFSVPGPITSDLSKGSNSLLQNGAIMATSGRDIIKVLRSKYQVVSINDVIPASSRHSRATVRLWWKGGNLQNGSPIPTSPSFAGRGGSGMTRVGSKLSKEEQEITNLLQRESLHFDEIVRTIGKPAKEIGSTLSMMEVKGIIKSRSGEYSIT